MRESHPQPRTERGRRWLECLVVALGLIAVAASLPAQTVGSAQPIGGVVIQPACPIAGDPTPSGVLDRPADFFNDGDYYWMHSATHLQGRLATEKHAPGLFYRPTSTNLFGDFQSALVINNPNTTSALQVQIFYYDTGGTLLTPAPPVRTIAAEGSYYEQATPLAGATPVGLGSARIVSVNGVEFVGATVHHAYQIGTVVDSDFLTPGATSMQQLQKKQSGKTRLWWGPIPVSNTTSIDFLNGILPFFWVNNPNAVPNTITIAISSTRGISLATQTITLQPYASHFDLALWNFLLPIYSSPSFNFDEDFYVTVTSSDDLPIIGEGILSDFFGDGGAWNLEPAGRFRMGSTMMSNTQVLTLVNPELTWQPSGPPVLTIMGVWNTNTVDVGPVRVQYRDRNGVSLGTDTVSSLPAGAVLRIGPGLASSPNYPTPPGGVFDGWVRISACKKGIVGWTMREIQEDNPFHFRKVYGEVLQGANGQEPGPGFPVVTASGNRTRKVSPLLQVDSGFFWPSYTNFVNNSVANVGPYEYRFFNSAGAAIGSGLFNGLPWGATSFTYEDPLINPGIFAIGSARVDHSSGQVEGIDAIGDPIVEWPALGFPPPPF